MISKTMTDALNDQINAELFSAYLYLSMSAHTSHVGLPGMAHWFFVQAQEELTHAQRIYNYVDSQGQRVILAAIEQPESEFSSVMAIFEKTLEHEQLVTKRINDLVNLALEERDHATEIFLQWFVSEQVEEEQNVSDIIAKLKLAGDQGGGLFMIDKELGGRAAASPVPQE